MEVNGSFLVLSPRYRVSGGTETCIVVMSVQSTPKSSKVPGLWSDFGLLAAKFGKLWSEQPWWMSGEVRLVLEDLTDLTAWPWSLVSSQGPG